MRLLPICAVPLILVFLTGCGSSTMPGSATEQARCEVWGKSLPTRSRIDTEQTKGEIQRAYATFDLSCPNYGHLLPIIHF